MSSCSNKVDAIDEATKARVIGALKAINSTRAEIVETVHGKLEPRSSASSATRSLPHRGSRGHAGMAPGQ